uniref:CCHC-type domain-containing protein n=1 Tax=Nicotiana tabacum TaxID=4097 RepID=A0A1S3YW66_TOBAC|nr:PREDICTED: uncharacterized protein LOC107780530 [Nicotiana tabacum]
MSTKKGPTDIASTSGTQLLDKKLSGLKVRPIDLSKNFADRLETVSDYKTETWSEFNKLKGVCTQEGLNLCNELKLSRQLKIDKLKEKSQLGDFCTQFGLPETSTQSRKKKNRYHRYPHPDSPYKKKRSRYRPKEERDTRKAHRESTRFTKNRSKRDLADIKCYKCGKVGHIFPNCKLQKLKTLELNDELRHKVYGLLYTPGSESDYYSKTESEDEVDLIDLSDSDKIVDTSCTACKEWTLHGPPEAEAYLVSKKQSNTFASIARDEDNDDIKSYVKLPKKEMIFLLENSEIQRKDEPWKIF